MIINNDRRIPFGKNTRGIRIDSLMLEVDDIKTLLRMSEEEIKRHMYTILPSLSRNSQSTNIPRLQEHENRKFSTEYWRTVQETAAVMESTKIRGKSGEILFSDDLSMPSSKPDKPSPYEGFFGEDDED